MDFSKQLFRCSSFGYIMINAKGKSNLVKYYEAVDKAHLKHQEYLDIVEKEETGTAKSRRIMSDYNKAKEEEKRLEPIKNEPHLSETCITYLSNLRTLIKYNRTEDIKSKYIEKGINLEEDAITLVSLVLGEMHSKNKERRSNEWLEGECDISKDNYVNDTKVNWDIYKFQRASSKKLDNIYKWQIKGYMWLWDKPKGRVINTLLNTPEQLIRREEKNLLNTFIGTEEDYNEACKEIRELHTYDNIPNEEKVFAHEVERNLEDELLIQKRVEECRVWLNNREKQGNNLKDTENETEN